MLLAELSVTASFDQRRVFEREIEVSSWTMRESWSRRWDAARPGRRWERGVEGGEWPNRKQRRPQEGVGFVMAGFMVLEV